jgi:hypothetical protein
MRNGRERQTFRNGSAHETTFGIGFCIPEYSTIGLGGAATGERGDTLSARLARLMTSESRGLKQGGWLKAPNRGSPPFAEDSAKHSSGPTAREWDGSMARKAVQARRRAAGTDARAGKWAFGTTALSTISALPL